jgi:hypothetical protein
VLIASDDLIAGLLNVSGVLSAPYIRMSEQRD